MRTFPTTSCSLPTPLTAFIGREREIEDVLELVSQHRLVTITGAGGSGKSRLALEVARRIASADPGTVRWVELAPLGRGDLLAQHVATQLRVHETPDHSALESLLEALQPPIRVVVLDNCEHVIEESAKLVELLLKHCSHIRVLATSRESLGIDGERVWLLRGLALESTGEGADRLESEAVRLFVDRASSASNHFKLTAASAPWVVQICNRLDGLPLAIELAAARVGILSAEQIAARLDDLFGLLTTGRRSSLPRHRTLKAAVDWSYRLVPPDEQELLQHLSVFAGAFSLEAAEHVCSGGGLRPDDVLDLLSGLVTRSLVTMHEQSEGARYSLLEVIRQYAEELLASAPERYQAMKRRHADYYASFAVEALPLLERHHSANLVAAITIEYDNLRAALQWSFSADGDRRLGHRLAGALWRYWGQTWQLSEAEHWWKEALAGPEPPESQDWGQVLNGAGTFMYVAGQLERGRELLDRAVGVLDRTGDRVHQVMALSTLAHISCTQQRFEAALEYAEHAARIARTLPEAWPLCHAMSNGLSIVHKSVGQFDLAEACLDEALAKAEQTGADPWGVASVARARARLAIDRGDLDEARERTVVAIGAVRNLMDPHLSMRTLLLAEKLYYDLGRHADAAQTSGTVAAARERGMWILPEELDTHVELTNALRQSLGDAVYSAAATQGATRTVDAALSLGAEQLVSGKVTTHARAAAVPDERPSHDLVVRVLGSSEILATHARVLEGPSHARCLELLIYLLANRDGQTRDEIGLAFWPDGSSVQVKNNFHVLLHKLRRGLGRADFIVAAGQRYRINPDLDVWFDVEVFERETAAALRELSSARTSERLEAALALYRGAFLEGAPSGDWSGEHRDRLQLLYARGLSALASFQFQHDAVDDAIATLERLTQTDELHEDSWRRFITCLVRSGRRDLALRHYKSLVSRLREQLGVEPEPATQALAHRLLGLD